MTLLPTTLIALCVSLSTGFASAWIGLFYSEMFGGVPLPLITRLAFWNAGALYWLFAPAVITILFAVGAHSRDGIKRRRMADAIILIAAAVVIVFMVGAALPVTTVTPYVAR